MPHSPAIAPVAGGATLNDDAAADARAEDHAEHHGGAGAGAVHRFRDSETVGVVGHLHEAPEAARGRGRAFGRSTKWHWRS